jgi:hypothetical protein
MIQISAKLQSDAPGRLSFWCPGCNQTHTLSVEGPGAIWGWDRNVDAPTFTPSVLMTSGHFVSSHKPGDACWCTYNATAKRKAPFTCKRCHSFVRAGRIQFLGDCSHALANQTVGLPDFNPSPAGSPAPQE